MSVELWTETSGKVIGREVESKGHAVFPIFRATQSSSGAFVVAMRLFHYQPAAGVPWTR